MQPANTKTGRASALLLAALFAVVPCFGGAGAEAFAQKVEPAFARAAAPVGTMHVELVKTVSMGTAKKYAVVLYFRSDAELVEFELDSIAVSGVSRGNFPFTVTKNNVRVSLAGGTGGRAVLGSVTLSSDAVCAWAVSSDARMRFAGQTGWFRAAGLNGAEARVHRQVSPCPTEG